jgi:predicted nicotinamide N-methyase
VDDDLVSRSVELPSGPLVIWQPREAAELPDDGPVEWAPVAPYWAVLWRSSVTLASELDRAELSGRRVIELGCGLGLPSIAAAKGGAEVLATDAAADALPIVQRNAEANDVSLQTVVADWSAPEQLVDHGPFDYVVASDVLYERQGVAALLSLLPQLASTALIADPGRPASHAFLEEAEKRWQLKASRSGVVSLYRLELADAAA